MPRNPRLDVVEHLEAAGWISDDETPLGLLRCNGAAWGVTSDAGDSSLTEPACGETIRFPSGTPAEVIVAACLAAAEQTDDLVHQMGRLYLALASAKRRAARRQPHVREGLIFNLERENRLAHAYAKISNEAAQVSHSSWQAATTEARTLRERNAELLARIDALLKRLDGPAAGREPEPPAERYAIGRNGVFATLYDRQEHRLVVDNATEEHCQRVRDELLAAQEPPQPVPLLKAVQAAYDAAVAHATACRICWPGMRFTEMCGDGQREALAGLHAVQRAQEPTA